MKMIASPLFDGFTEKEYIQLMGCSCIHSQNYTKGDYLLFSGDTTKELGIVLRGSVTIENIDFWGNRNLLANIAKGEIFAETYAITGSPLMVDVVAAEDTGILFLNAFAIYHGMGSATSWHQKIIQNLLMISAKKNLARSIRTFQISFKKCRPRITAYLSGIARQSGSNEFDIPFNRQELADYLNLDRSALSKELMHMKNEGWVDYHKNHFCLKKNLY